MSFKVVIAVSWLAAVSYAVVFERRPDLGEFQDEKKCFPYKTPWVAVLRNFENDEFFGGKSKCIRITPTAPLTGNVAEDFVEYGPTGKTNTKILLTSTEGYQHNNVLNVTFLDGPGKGSTFDMFSVYSECDRCKIFRNAYAGENACSMFVPVTLKNKVDPACQFIFNLLCGSANHYSLLDDTCSF
ncbi:uncharacterized protein LOC144153769 [Haemaphysalis longicornis]